MEKLSKDLLVNIFIRLLAKQVAQMRCVSKSWNALLSQSSFVKSHLHHSINNNDRTLLVFYKLASSSNPKPFTAHPCQSPHIKLTNKIKPPSGPTSSIIKVIGSIHGLICSYYEDDVIHIWNPSLSTVSTLPPYSICPSGCHEIYFRFGFDPKTDDYKLVKLIGLTVTRPPRTLFATFGYVVEKWLQVEVYSMRKGSWKLITQTFPSHVTRISKNDYVCVDGQGDHLHWHGCIDEEGEVQTMVAFDLGSETFREIPFPNFVLDVKRLNVLGALEGKLCVMSVVATDGVCEVWVMDEYGVAESWVKCHVFSQFLGDVVYGSTLHNEVLIVDKDFHVVLYDLITRQPKILKKSCRGKFGVGKVLEYVDSLVWIAPAQQDKIETERY